MRAFGPLILATLLASCAGNPGRELSVDLRTDYVAAVEFDNVVVTVDGGREQTLRPTFGTDYVIGRRVAEYAGLGSGSHAVRVVLMRRGSEVAARDITFDLSADLAITVVVTRDCRGVECPGAGNATDTACLGGTCVDPRCTPETPEFCPAPVCEADDDCPLPEQPCAVRLCLEGTCFVADEGTCPTGQYCDSVRGCVIADIDPPDGGVDGGDAGTDTGTPDTGPPPCEPACEGFSYCVDGMCVDGDRCLTDESCPGDTICRNRRCVPGDLDIDGDGVPAAMDCDETRPDAYPDAPEFCNLADEDCDGMIDEGNPGVLCADDEAGGECREGVCGCPEGRFDLDGVADTGCECEATPGIGNASTCDAPIDLGTVSDTATGDAMMVMANALPLGRDVWYRFRGADIADTTCDNYHVRVRFADNPGDAYRFVVNRGGCTAPACPGEAFTDFSYATDFRDGAGLGECPCFVSRPRPAAGRPGQNHCVDNSSDYFVRVFRRADAALACAPFALEVSNGLYNTP